LAGRKMAIVNSSKLAASRVTPAAYKPPRRFESRI
jgi:hypothetical protein